MGGASQIKAEFLLLDAAIKRGPYDFYHLITGADFPIVSQNTMLKFYDANKDFQFISCSKIDAGQNLFWDRIKYYYPFQELFSRRNPFGKAIREIGLKVQKILSVNRLDDNIDYGVGSAYFDITDDFARYVLSQKEWVNRNFRYTFCADEVFIQTVYLNSPFYKEDRFRWKSDFEPSEFIAKTYLDVHRAIDWKRGRPYTFKSEDIEILEKSHCFFARKIDERVDEGIVDHFYSKIVLE